MPLVDPEKLVALQQRADEIRNVSGKPQSHQIRKLTRKTSQICILAHVVCKSEV